METQLIWDNNFLEINAWYEHISAPQKLCQKIEGLSWHQYPRTFWSTTQHRQWISFKRHLFFSLSVCFIGPMAMHSVSPLSNPSWICCCIVFSLIWVLSDGYRIPTIHYFCQYLYQLSWLGDFNIFWCAKWSHWNVIWLINTHPHNLPNPHIPISP